MKSVNVLFTSVGRRVELLRQFRNSYQLLGLTGKIIALDIDPLAPGLQIADRPYLVPRLTAADYLPTLVEICQREQIDLIFPLIDPDISLLAKHRATLEATGAKVVAVSGAAAECTSDKWQTTHFFASLGLNTARSWLPSDLVGQAPEYPLFIKPRNGSGAKNTFQVRHDRELAFFAEYVPNPIIEEFLPGEEITNDVVCDFDGKLLGVISRQRIEVRWGEVAKGVTIYNPEIIDACVKIAQALPAIGPITVQCIMKQGKPYFTEINARFGGGVPLGVAAGFDSPTWLLAHAAGIPYPIPPLGCYQTGLYMTRYDESYFLNEAQRAAMASHHL